MKKILTSFILVLFALVLVACKTTEYTVSFETNGGSAVADVVVEKDDKVGQPASPTRDGYIFDGWYTSEQLTTAYNWNAAVTEDLVLYAKWTELAEDQYVVSFDSQGGSFVAPIIVEDGEAVAKPANPIREGYNFVAWNLNNSAYNFATPVTGNLSLVATWALKGQTTKAETYYTYISETTNLNPYSETLANASDLYSLVSDALYEGDYDWATAIDEGIADEVGDFTNTANLPFNYFPAMAADLPEDVLGNGTVWRVELKSNLQFVDGTPINAHTFDYSYQQLLDPLLLNARATNLFETDALPLVNGRKYFEQNSPDTDALGIIMYTVGGVQYSVENAYYGKTDGGYDIYHVENMYEDLIGPDGELAFVEDWGDAAYGSNGWVLETEADAYFKVGTDEKIYAPYAGWTLDGVAFPSVTDLPEGVEIKAGAAQYAGARPAYMDAEGNRPAELDEDGIPVGGEETYDNAIEVLWSEVGFKVIDDLTMEFTLTSKKSQWQVMTQLSSAITSVVHPENFEAGLIEDGTRTTYGTIDNPLVAFGAYELTEWEPGAFFIFTRNEDFYAADDYDIKTLRYDIISDQSVAVAEFIKGNLDVAGVSGEYFPVYENSEYLKLTPATTFFRFAFSLDRGRDDDPSNDTPIMQDPDFRLALYFATDRETFVTDVRSPGYATQAILGPLYYSSEQNPFSYRASEQGQDVMADFSPDTFGYDPVQAKSLFDAAYAQAVTDGLYEDGEVVKIEFVFFDAESNHTMANWLESTWENIFGAKFDLVKTPVDNDTLDGIWDNGNFDLTFGGWQGMQFWAPGMLQVYSDVWGAPYILEVGFETGNAELEVDLARGKVAVTTWLAELEAITEPTETDLNYIDLFEEFLAGFDGDMYTATYDELGRDIYYVVLDYDLYDGRDVDFDNITAAMEGELLRQMINIPLFTTVGASIYSSRVVFDAQEYHARMGWGGLKYMSLAS